MPGRIKYSPFGNTRVALASQSGGAGTDGPNINVGPYFPAIVVHNPTIFIVLNPVAGALASVSTGPAGGNPAATAKIQYTTNGGAGWIDVGSSRALDDMFVTAGVSGPNLSDLNAETSGHTVEIPFTGQYSLDQFNIRAWAQASITIYGASALADSQIETADWYITADSLSGVYFEA